MTENTKDNLQIQSPQDLLKKCRKCEQEKPATLEYFFKHPGGKYGLTPRCKPCVNEDNKKWSKANKERVLENANKRSKKYYHNNLDKARETARNSAAKARQDPEKYAKIKARRRAGYSGLTPEEIEAIRVSQNNQCAICNDPNPTDLDHCHEYNQIRWLLCKHCNRGLGAFRDNPHLMKKAASMIEWFLENQEDQPVGSRFK